MQKNNLILFVGTILFLLTIIFLNLSKPVSQPIDHNKIKIKETSFNLEVADTDLERMKGLSSRTSLEAKNVLLFVFEKEERHGIWMKDMYFPIDIAWIDKDKKIIHIEKEVSPNTFPKVFRPEEVAMYVIELNSGLIDLNKIKIGDSVEF